jgi:hypothetical protein
MAIREGRIKGCWTSYPLPVFRRLRPSLHKDDAIDGTVERGHRAVHR